MKSFCPSPRTPRHNHAFGVFSRVIIVPALAVALVALFSYLSLRARAQGETALLANGSQNSKLEFVPGELLVRFRPGSAMARTKDKRPFKLELLVHGKNIPVQLERFAGSDLVEGLMLARIAAEDSLLAIKGLETRDDVLYAEPNFIRHASAVPNDTRYADLWAMKSPAQVSGGISAEPAWDTTTGSHGVVVGVIDSGIDTGHADLKDNIFVNTGEIAGNGVDDDGNGFIDDVNGWDFVSDDKTVFDSATADAHGTHVAGTIGARGNNSLGVVGVNWDVQLMPLKVLGPSGGTDANLIEAYQYARAMRQRGVNLRVLNNSYGGQGFSQSLRDAINELNSAGILFIAAAGNEETNNDFVPAYPASYELPNVISVAASDRFNFLATGFTNFGKQSVHLAAPGNEILSTTPRGYSGGGLVTADTEPDGSTYSIFSGTSMAAPHVTGAAALACTANPNLSLQQLRSVVLFSGDESGNFLNATTTGRRLNVNKTLQAALENDTTAPAVAANFRVNSQNGCRVELRWTEAGDDGTASRASLDEISFVDAGTSQSFRLDAAPAQNPGTERTVFISVPVKHAAGQLVLRTLDNLGNSSTANATVNVAADVADPYIVTPGPPAGLTALNSGTKVGVKGDDVIKEFVTLPFQFPFFGATTQVVAVSSNGAMYVVIPPDFAVPRPNNGQPTDAAVATTDTLERLAMIAGMWADLRTDRAASDDVYMVQPNADTVIFRWQAVKFGSETPANFEIELRRDGTIQTRYGAGNDSLSPVIVGISAGDPAAYVVPTHTSETSAISLTNAPTVTFAPRNPAPLPTSDLAVTITDRTDPLVSGQNLTYDVKVTNLGPNDAEDLVMTDVLPSGTTFVSCTSSHINATCTGPAVGTNGTVTGRRSLLSTTPNDTGINFVITVNVTAPPGTSLQNTTSATSFRADPNTSNNSATSTTTIVAESFFDTVRAIAAGRSHTTSIRNDGTVWNWGTGSDGQLGDGNAGIGVGASTPVQVTGAEGFTSVADGNGFVLALKGDGTVWGWGYNGLGQLGDGTTVERRSRPVQTVGLSNVIAVGAGDFYSVAVKSDGSVWTWGSDGGIGSTTFGTRTTPAQMTGISNVVAIAAGGHHLLMLKTDKTVWAVGLNSRGQLGDGTTTDRAFPVQVNGLTNVRSIAAAGDEFSEAVKEDGTVWAWGINFNGQLGPGGGPMNFDAHPNPLQVTGLPGGMTAIVTGNDFCLALAGDGSVWSWGNNTDFQLGQGFSVGQNPTPHQIPNFGGVAALDAGVNHSVALKTDGSVWTWGGNSEGQLGDGTITMHLPPARVSGLLSVSAPSFNPPGGHFNQAVDVTITSATPGATIRYTTNGSLPTESSPVFPAGGIHLTSFTLLNARAWKSGYVTSSTTFAQYDVSVPPNPIDNSQFFVRQHYLDFFNREPDAAGLTFWTNNIESCNNDAQCREVKRIDTSAAFFLSIEFQETGYLVHRVYKVAYGNLPGKPVPLTRAQFVPDLQQIGQGVVVGQGNWQALLETNKRNYLDQFVQRAEFVARYPGTLTAAQFVDGLNANTGSALTASERDALVADLNSNAKTRAEVLRAVAENAEVGRREVNGAFVLMQYFGYLRRNPNDAPEAGLDFGGYHFWLGKLNEFNGDFRKADMVKAFIVSSEYRARFSQ